MPIAKVDDAGITTTGAATENKQLKVLVKEYREYCENVNLWTVNTNDILYKVGNGTYIRVNGKEETVIHEESINTSITS